MDEGYHPIWGRLRGKLSTTPEEAKEMFGFEMREGAKGLYFAVIRGKQVICNLMPHRNPRTRKQMVVRDRMKVLRCITGEIRGILRDVWLPVAKRKGYWGGWVSFVQENCDRVGLPPDWMKLDLTRSNRNGVVGSHAVYNASILRIDVKGGKGELGIGVLEPSVFRFRHIEARRYRLPGTLYIGFDYQLRSPLIIYLYLRNGNEYSRTFAIRGEHGKVYRKSVGNNKRKVRSSSRI